MKDTTTPTWTNQLLAARKMSTSDLKPHAAVSTDNRHRCEDCFCCAALTVIEERNGAEYNRLTGLHIEGRRWFQRGPGNTYHSVRIRGNGEHLATLPYQYGYDDCYLQTALEWLAQNKYIPCGRSKHFKEEQPPHNCARSPQFCQPVEYGTLYVRETLNGTYSVIDVQRKKDL